MPLRQHAGIQDNDVVSIRNTVVNEVVATGFFCLRYARSDSESSVTDMEPAGVVQNSEGMVGSMQEPNHKIWGCWRGLYGALQIADYKILRHDVSSSSTANQSFGVQQNPAGTAGITHQSTHTIWGGIDLTNSSVSHEEQEETSSSSQRVGMAQNSEGIDDATPPCGHKIWGRVDLSSSPEVRQRLEGLDISEWSSDDKSSERKATEMVTLLHGSEGHENGLCRPCAYFVKTRGCNLGDDCDFCHLHHPSFDRPRPGKYRREQMKRLADAVYDAFSNDHARRSHRMEELSQRSDYMRTVIDAKVRNENSELPGGNAGLLSETSHISL